MKLEQLKKQAHELFDEYRALARANAEHESLRHYVNVTNFSNDFMINELYKDMNTEQKLEFCREKIHEFNEITLMAYGIKFINLECGYVND